MALRSSGNRKLSFEILSETRSFEEDDRSLLYRSTTDPIGLQSGVAKPSRNSRKKKKQKKKKEAMADSPVIQEDPVAEQCGNSSSGTVMESTSENYGIRDNGSVNRISCVGSASVVVVEESVCQNVCGFGELRQRNVIGGGEEMAAVASRAEEDRAEMIGSKEPLPPAPPQPVANGNGANKLETAESLDWKRLMLEDPNCERLCISVDMCFGAWNMEHGRRDMDEYK